MNYEGKVHKVEDILNNWQKKSLTLPGKITIVKTIGLHYVIRFAYVLSRQKKPMTCFSWDIKRDKIKRSEIGDF